MASSAQARAHRRDLNELVRLAQSDLRVVFDRHSRWTGSADGEMAAADPEATRDDLLVVMPRLIAVYGAAAATLAADFYDDLRDEEGLSGPRFIAAPAELPDDGRADTLVRWGVGALFAEAADWATSFNNTAGGLQRVIADADRSTITQSSTEDRRSPGWERSTSGGCTWCDSLAGAHTGPDFGSHDHCGCIAVPRFA
jgi:hypothetical protein